MRSTSIDLESLLARQKDIQAWQAAVQSRMIVELQRHPDVAWFDSSTGSALYVAVGVDRLASPCRIELAAPRAEPLQCFRKVFELAERLLLGHQQHGFFLAGVEGVYLGARHAMQTWPEAWLLWLIYRASTSISSYGTQQALLVASTSWMTAMRLNLGEDQAAIVFKSGLTKDISICQIKDVLALERRTMAPDVRRGIRARAAQSRSTLESLGVKDSLWLRTCSAAQGCNRGEGLARIVWRAQRFAGAACARGGRPGLAPNLAVSRGYVDEHGRPDKIGAALVKSLGIYPPGSLVGLQGGAIALVLKRGPAAHLPEVIILTAQGQRSVERQGAVLSTAKGQIRACLPVTASRIQIDIDQVIELAT